MSASSMAFAQIQYAQHVDGLRTSGYLVVGGILLIIGAVLMGVSTIVYPHTPGVTTLDDVRKAFHRDKQREAMFGSGIAILTSGALLFVGFGLTALVIGKQTHNIYNRMLAGTQTWNGK